MVLQRPGIPIPVCDRCGSPMELDPPTREEIGDAGEKVLVADYACRRSGCEEVPRKTQSVPLKRG